MSTVRVTSSNTYKTMALIHYTDGRCAWEETTLTGPISEAHYRRGHLLRDARLGALLSMKDHIARAALPDFGLVELSKVQMGQIEADATEWAALWRALDQEEPQP